MLTTTGFRNRWILFPIAITFPGERIQKNRAGHSELFIIYMWICNINIGFMLWFHDLFIVNSVGGLFPMGNFSSSLFPCMVPIHPASCGRKLGNLTERSTSVRKTHPFGQQPVFTFILSSWGIVGIGAMAAGQWFMGLSLGLCNKHYAHTWKSQMCKIPQSICFQSGLFLMLNFLAGTEIAWTSSTSVRRSIIQY